MTLTLQTLLTHPDFDREDTRLLTGKQWLELHEVAAESCEKHPDGLTPGMKVVTLRSGFGGGPGKALTIEEFDGQGWSADGNKWYQARHPNSTCLIEIACWWKQVAVHDNTKLDVYLRGLG